MPSRPSGVPVRLLRNDRGRFADITAEVGLHERTGRWNGVSAGDFDGDGLPDLVAISWGDNTEYRATAEAPLELFFGDVDLNGTLDLVEAQRDVRLGAMAPLAALGRLAEHIPPVGARMPTRAAYAEADVGEALGTWPEGRLAAAELRHLVFLNRGGTASMPSRCRRRRNARRRSDCSSPTRTRTGARICSCRRTSSPPTRTRPATTRVAACGWRGDGSGGFRALPGRESGVAAYGDQRGAAAADVDGDGRLDFVLGVNGGAARLFRGTGTPPGLRVRIAGPDRNRYGIGAVLRVVYADGPSGRSGPAREVRAGSGTGSHDDPVQLLGLSGAPAAIEVRWPGGVLERYPVPPGAAEVTVGPPGSGGG